ncbi:MAG TPA: DNA-processing protein DprA, partial [Sphingomonadaceae bacterium]|nr:DNA-processing protein DprA [Sphingomonadaceae bacterium]
MSVEATPTATLSQDEAFARIRLLRSPHVGPVSFRQLMRRFGSATAALEALPDLAAKGGGKYRAAPRDRVEAEVAAVRRAGARYLFHDSPDYPPLLTEIDSAPPVLTVRGDAGLGAKPCIAMVGARNASAAAMRLARDMAGELAGEGFTVV